MRGSFERCPLCPSRNLPREEQKKVVSGSGPADARVFLLGEAPGRQEANMGVPFCGKTGSELDQTYLPLAGLMRHEVWVTNSCCCHWADASDAPPPELVRSCSEFHVRQELEDIQPETVVLMGGIAHSLLDLNVDMVQGTGRYGSLFGWSGRIWSTYHPALGMHQGSKMQNLLDSFRRLRGFLAGEIGPQVDTLPNPVFLDLASPEAVDEAMEGFYEEPIAVDTEASLSWKGLASTKRYRVWCATFCIHPGRAYMVRVSNWAAWERFGWHLRRFKRFLMHNMPFDMAMLAQGGIQLDWERGWDTMDMAYVLARLPKGLKPLGYQLIGAQSPSFEDVVRPYGMRAAMEYFEQVASREWPEPVQEWTGEMETRKCPTCEGKTVLVDSRLELCSTCEGSGAVMGKKKPKQCPACGGKLVKSIKEYRECRECEAGYIVRQKMTRKQGVNQKVNRLITDFVSKGFDLDPWERFESWWDSTPADVQYLIEQMGPPPLPSVDLVPSSEILSYAGTDAHSTRRLFPVLARMMLDMRREYKHETQERANYAS